MAKITKSLINRLARSYRVQALADEVLRLRPRQFPLGPSGHLALHNSPYTRPAASNDESVKERPALFITARFRTGSTWLWNLFTEEDGYSAYYEPLNEKRWFSTDNVSIDPTHHNSKPYSQNYQNLEHLEDLFTESWSTRHFYMDAAAHDPAMEAYFSQLIQAADGFPVLQCNRIDFRLDWVRSRFPQAKILHLYRNPRDQWQSSLGKDVLIADDMTLDDFPQHDRFYLCRWWKELSRTFPFLWPLKDQHPYAAFYAIWFLSYSFGRSYADHSVSYEQLQEDTPAQMNEITAALELPAIAPETIRPFLRADSDALASPARSPLYDKIEQTCEDMLDTVFAGHVQNSSQAG